MFVCKYWIDILFLGEKTPKRLRSSDIAQNDFIKKTYDTFVLDRKESHNKSSLFIHFVIKNDQFICNLFSLTAS